MRPRVSGPMSDRISVIVPARNEARSIAATLAPLREPEVLEVIVVDGASEDATREVARPLADRVLAGGVGRATQMNAGAAVARGEIFFFLHADTIPPEGFAASIIDACRGAVGGRFDLALDARGVAFRVIETAINLRSRWSGVFTGDQGLFIRRDVFEDIGGYPNQALLEDIDLSRAMRRHGRVVALRQRLRTSPRRWQRHGVVRTVALMWWIRTLYFLGHSPERLARMYRDAR
jgi:rSAM/selenodomain-associated transferase 2